MKIIKTVSKWVLLACVLLIIVVLALWFLNVPEGLIDWRGNKGRVDDNGQYYEFMTHLWVGTQEQYAQFGMKDYSNPKPGPIFPINDIVLDN